MVGCEMIDWKEAIRDVIFGILFIFTTLFTISFVKGMMCDSYGMDYSIILGQCVVRGIK